MNIAKLATQWLDGLATNLIDQATAEKFIIEAAREYQAWGNLSVENADFDNISNWTYAKVEITAQTELTISEWGVVKPLAELFAERESALIQESSRVASHEPYGRSSAEIQSDITNYRIEYMRKFAFSMPPTTI